MFQDKKCREELDELGFWFLALVGLLMAKEVVSLEEVNTARHCQYLPGARDLETYVEHVRQALAMIKQVKGGE